MGVQITVESIRDEEKQVAEGNKRHERHAARVAFRQKEMADVVSEQSDPQEQKDSGGQLKKQPAAKQYGLTDPVALGNPAEIYGTCGEAQRHYGQREKAD